MLVPHDSCYHKDDANTMLRGGLSLKGTAQSKFSPQGTLNLAIATLLLLFFAFLHFRKLLYFPAFLDAPLQKVAIFSRIPR